MLHEAVTAKFRDIPIFDAHVAAVLELLLGTARAGRKYDSSSLEDAACLVEGLAALLGVYRLRLWWWLRI